MFSDSKPPLSTEAEVTIQLDVAAALQEEESSLKQFRDQVREYLEDHHLAEYEKVFLEQFRQELGLSISEVQQIIDEEQAPILVAQQAYRNRLNGLIQSGLYPFNSRIEAELKKFQQQRNLMDAEVNQISQPILEAAEEDYQEKIKQQKQAKVKRQSPLKAFEFQVPTIGENCTITYRRGQAEYFVEALSNGVTLEMVLIPGGTFIMGSPDNELDRTKYEGPQHQVTIQSLFMGKFVVTQAQWRAVAALPKVNQDLDPDPSDFKGDNRPVEEVSWHDAIEFCDRLVQKTGKQYRLPSESEWEYACRAGTTTPFHFGETITTDLANYRGTDNKEYNWSGSYGRGPKGIYREETTSIDSFSPNSFGLYDMHGNVWEWCADHWHENCQGAPIDGSAWITGGNSNRRLMRGGSCVNYPRRCRSAYRYYHAPDFRSFNLGFRVVCVLA